MRKRVLIFCFVFLNIFLPSLALGAVAPLEQPLCDIEIPLYGGATGCFQIPPCDGDPLNVREVLLPTGETICVPRPQCAPLNPTPPSFFEVISTLKSVMGEENYRGPGALRDIISTAFTLGIRFGLHVGLPNAEYFGPILYQNSLYDASYYEDAFAITWLSIVRPSHYINFQERVCESMDFIWQNLELTIHSDPFLVDTLGRIIPAPYEKRTKDIEMVSMCYGGYKFGRILEAAADLGNVPFDPQFLQAIIAARPLTTSGDLPPESCSY